MKISFGGCLKSTGRKQEEEAVQLVVSSVSRDSIANRH